MPLQETSGAASYDAFGGGAPGIPNYIEDVFSTWLYTTNGTTTQAIQNGIDLSTYGGLVWEKPRSSQIHALSTSGLTGYLQTNSSAAPTGGNATLTTNGYTMNSGYYWATGLNVASWTFRKQPKFFDVVTYTGDGTSSRNISHSLASVPGCIIVKRTDDTSNWPVQHQSLAGNQFLYLNTTAAVGSIAASSTTTSTTFQVGTSLVFPNASGATYVAYLFAHNAGGFGLTGTDNVISCGSFTQPSSGNATITLGYEPQWVLIKRSDSTSNWFMYDTMRGMSLTNDAELLANTSAAEGFLGGGYVYPTATGFISVSGNFSAGTYIYIAIRRGPMKTPTSGTSVFSPVTYTGNATAGTVRTTSILTDMVWSQNRQGNANPVDYDRLRGAASRLIQATTGAEETESGTTIGVSGFDNMTGYTAGQDQGAGGINFNSWTYVNWAFRRAPGFFDVVCYTGNGINGTTQSHNLGVTPEMWIVKKRSAADNWVVGTTARGSNVVELDSNGAEYDAGTAYFSNGSVYTAPTSSVIWLGSNARVNASGSTFVAYLFATVPGVSKVGSYTGNGTSQTINCGFTSGARFLLIKATSTSGDWYVWDTARGITSSYDPFLRLNLTNAEIGYYNVIVPNSTGFGVQNDPEGQGNPVNTAGVSYLYLAIV